MPSLVGSEMCIRDRRCFGYGCWLRCCWDGTHAGKIHESIFVRLRYYYFTLRLVYCCCCCWEGICIFVFGRGAAAANHFSCWLRWCCCWCLCCLQHQYWSRERYRLLILPLTFLSFTLRCCGRLLLLLFLAASISVIYRLRCFGYGFWLRCCWDGMHAGKIRQAFFSVSATTTFLYVYSIAVAAIEKGYVFVFFWSRCCCCWSIFLLAALLLLLVLVLLTTSVLKQREVPATDSSFYVCLLYTSPSPRD